MPREARTIQFRSAGVALVLDVPESGAPRVLHWGKDTGPLTEADVDALRLTGLPGIGSGMPDSGMPLTLLPAHAEGWLWTPGITGHRGGSAFSPAFTGTAADVEETAEDALIAHRARIASVDEENGLRLVLHVEMTRSGLVRTRAELTNTRDGVYDLASLDVTLPVPGRATELLDMAGRQLRERELQRSPFTIGSHLRESRRSSGHEASVILAAGTPGFGWRHGEVWGVHLAWSGNTRALAERNNMGMSTLAGGELLLPGEVRLSQDESYVSPWLYASSGSGLDAMSSRFHDFLRARPEHPVSERPVTLNVWEAVYFDHDLDRLVEIADRAAEIGVERYVLDDGWFRHRRDDTAGLGDWYVDDGVWPEGLHPLTDAVTARGMQFGLWFEPEMINEDSDLARAHPEWIMAAGPRLPHPQRHQQVLNLTIPEAYAHIRDRILAILDEYPIAYIKWDHNRALTEPGDRTTGRPVAHEQVEALYRLLDEIRAAHPDLEIESCASGGGRIDLGIMARADRIWGSDCIDPLERQQIEAGTSLLLPPEMVGSHVASPVSHTTGRAHSLGFRAGTAFFSHMGIEWDVTKASDADRATLAEWIALHKRHRALLHTGRVVHADDIGDGLWTHGVVAQDGEEALFAVAAVRTGSSWPNARVTLPGLDGDRRYRLTALAPADAPDDRRTAHSTPAWWPGAVVLPGAALQDIGVQVPSLNPEQLVLLHLTAV